ncbi:MAG: hypothetical protein ACK5SQ_05375 [Chitinophagales bacterium]|jgi:hypothetical protein
MVKHFFILLVALFIGPMFNAGCQAPEPEIVVTPSLLKLAETFDFKYMETLEKAKKGDINAIKEFIRFNRIADGTDGLDHAVACLELIPIAGDMAFSQGCRSVTPNMRAYLAERLSVAQGRTKKTELQVAMKQWAPLTWEILNPAEAASTKEGVDGSFIGTGQKKPGAENSNDATLQKSDKPEQK